MSVHPNREEENAPPFNSRRATEFILFMVGVAVIVTAASAIADVVQSPPK